jgi:hypothetical protein
MKRNYKKQPAYTNEWMLKNIVIEFVLIQVL